MGGVGLWGGVAGDEKHRGRNFMAVQLNQCRQRLWRMMILCGSV